MLRWPQVNWDEEWRVTMIVCLCDCLHLLNHLTVFDVDLGFVIFRGHHFHQ